MVSRGGLLLLAALLPSAARHPTHTSSAELTCGGDSVHVTIRMFADDAWPHRMSPSVALA